MGHYADNHMIPFLNLRFNIQIASDYAEMVLLVIMSVFDALLALFLTSKPFLSF